ncbi:unnamed protein product [Adineta ricciae]|uniref:Methyltransferase type 11 domain-containing protein n=1 Tax=Adineta ricciae TaxID=249248 RepID=A0A815UIH9_ADIRI|nr:unnamed protein product [Adineta ricciae]CAF1514383.1 unnamed protein product [Adineta ricciae]
MKMISSVDGINPLAISGFDKAASNYDECRPTYAEDIISFIRNLQPTTIVDVGAGTGKLTRLLLSTGAQTIIAVEPVEKMRCQLPTTVTILSDSATNMNIPDNTVDVVTCGQSFHWFATSEALKEIHRILKPGGILVLVWNTTDANKKEAWHDEFTEYVDSFAPMNTCRYKSMKWKSVFENEPQQELFSMPLSYIKLNNNKRMTIDKFIGYTLTGSFLASLPEETRTTVNNRLHQIIYNHLNTANKDMELDIPFVTDVYWSIAKKD